MKNLFESRFHSLLFLDGPKWFQYLGDVSLDLRRRRCSRELVEVVPILVLDDSRAQRDSLVRPDVFPAKVSRIGCPGHVEFENWLTCVDTVMY